MEDLPDVLDLLGKTPREFGALHVHFESAAYVDQGRAVASLLLQGAFAPMPESGSAVFLLATGEGQAQELARFPLPQFARGEVLRMRFPLRVPDGTEHLYVRVEAPAPAPSAKRVRPAWKLFDTLEIPKLSEMKPSYSSVDVNMGASVLATAALGGAGFAVFFSTDGVDQGARSQTTVHKARELPQVLTVPLARDGGSAVEAAETAVLWEPGQPLPEPAPLPAPIVTAERRQGVRRCVSCYFEGPMSEYEFARSCPSCDAPFY